MKYSITHIRTISPLTALCLAIVLLPLIHSCSAPKSAAGVEVIEKDGIEQESILTSIDSTTIDTAEMRPDTVEKTTTEQKTVADTDTVIVDSLLSRMTLREKIGQLFFTSGNGYFRSEDDESYRELVGRIQNHHLGGIIYFRGDVYGQAVLNNKLQRISKIPLWITQDMEYGAAMRVEGTTRFVPAMGIAATQNTEYAYWKGKITAKEARALGVHQIFAPVLDVNNNPENPVINVRSFSGDPRTVANFGRRFIEGAQSEGIVSTAKHFPGHGDTDVDSHLALPVINNNFSRLDSVELVPFRAAVQSGVSSIMTAHIAFPQIGDTPSLPATMNRFILDRVLTDSLKFNGMIVTDGLEMQGIAANYSPGEAVINSLKAGADLMLLSPDELTAIDEVARAVERGRLSESRIDRSVRKLLKWKKDHGLFKNHQVDIERLSSEINTLEHRLIADEISRKSLTLVKNEENILPIRPSKYPRITVISVADNESGSAGSYFASRLKEHHPMVTSHVLDNRTGQEEKDRIMADVRKADLIIIGSFIYVRSGQPVQLSDEHLSFLKRLPRNKSSLLVAFGNPYIVQDLPDTDAQLMAWSAHNSQVKNTVPALFGGSEISGRLPIEIPGLYKRGHGINLPQTTLRNDEPEVAGMSRKALQKIDSIMQEAVFDSTFPGGTVAVVKDGIIAYQKGFGYHTYDKVKKVRSDDIYDLASLTKVVATTSAVMKLLDEGKLHLDDKVGDYIAEFSEPEKESITIRSLLLHESGLPAFRVYIDKLQSAPEIVEAVKNEPLTYKPGHQYEYSDLGLILLGKIIEQVTGTSLDRYVDREIFYPMGMNSTYFNPRNAGRWISNRIPPTEQDTVYRMKTLQAEVHDERAYYLGGVAGHAGLFSNVRDLAAFSQMLLSKGVYGGRRYFNEETVEMFTARQSELVNRGYGFDRKSGPHSTAGSLTGDNTFGHTGFTGTSLWIDPDRNMAVIILTNRTYPRRSYGKQINLVRAAVADAAVLSIVE